MNRLSIILVSVIVIGCGEAQIQNQNTYINPGAGAGGADAGAGGADAGGECPLGSHGCPCIWSYPPTGPATSCATGLTCEMNFLQIYMCCSQPSCFEFYRRIGSHCCDPMRTIC